MYLKPETKASLEDIIKKTIEEIAEMDFEEELRYVREQTKQPLIFSKKIDSRMNHSENLLINRRKIATIEDIDKKMSKLK